VSIQIPVDVDYLFAKIGRLVVENDLLHQRLVEAQSLAGSEETLVDAEPKARDGT
jgi:hypothetical protein